MQHYPISAQNPDTLLKQDPDIGFTSDKIELLFHDLTVQSTYSNGIPYSYDVEVPHLRINGGPLLELDRHLTVLDPYFKTCRPAALHLDKYRQDRRRGRLAMTLGIVGGGVLPLVGFFSSVKHIEDKGSGALLFSGVGLGAAVFTGGILINKHQKRKAMDELESAVIFYNDNCYRPAAPFQVEPAAPPADTLPPKPSAPEGYGVQHQVRDTVLYHIYRNDPKNVHVWSLALIPFDLDLTNAHYTTFRVGGQFSYQLGARFGLNAGVKYGVIDNLADAGYAGEQYAPSPLIPGVYYDVVIPEKYRRGLEVRAVSSIGLMGREKKKSTSVFVATKVEYGRRVEVYTDIKVKRYSDWALRAGATYYRSVLQSPTGLNFRTGTPPPQFYDPITGGHYPGSFGSLPEAAAMMQTAALQVGWARRWRSDLHYTTDVGGEKQLTKLLEVYLDAYVAPVVRFEDVTYYYYLGDRHNAYLVNLDATKASRFGIVGGAQYSGLKKHSGWVWSAELGIRPGISGGYTQAPNLFTSVTAGWLFGGR